MNKLHKQTIIEKWLAGALRHKVLSEIRGRKLNQEQVGVLLGIFPTAVEVLMQEDAWGLEESLRIANAIMGFADLRRFLGYIM